MKQISITVWLKREIVLDWPHYCQNPGKIFGICTREPGDIDYMQVNISYEMYKAITVGSPLTNEYGKKE